MANYPTFTPQGNEKDYLTTIWDSKMWDISQMPSKLYLHTGGVLVAIRPKFFVQVQCNTEHVEGSHCIFGFERAGACLCIMRVNTYNGPSILFQSPEDFERFKTGGDGAYQIPVTSASNILRENGYSWELNGGLRLWHNNAGVPSHSAMYYHFRVWTDRDGAHAEHQQSCAFRGTLYKTREECAAAIPKAQVVEFEDEREKEPIGIMDETNGHESELVRRINDAWDKWWEEFEPILCALYARDISEIYHSDAFSWPEDADDQFVLEEIQANWEMHAGNYLQHIADNQDLSTILTFLNYGNR